MSNKNNHIEQHQKAPSQNTLMASQTFIGPVPPPNILAEYEKLKEGLAHRIVAMAEKQAEHRQQLEIKRLELEMESNKRRFEIEFLNIKKQYWEITQGQIFSLIIALSTVFTGTYTALQGYVFPGAAIGSVGIIGIIWAFLKSRRK